MHIQHHDLQMNSSQTCCFIMLAEDSVDTSAGQLSLNQLFWAIIQFLKTNFGHFGSIVTSPRLGERRSSSSSSSRRSSSDVIEKMLYGNATKDDLKNRNNTIDEDDSDEITSDEADCSPRNTRRQSNSVPKYILKKTTSAGRINFKIRRNSVEDSSERDGSPSPPLDPDKPGIMSSRTLPRRTKSNSNSNSSITKSISNTSITPQNNRKTSYAFGSSTERFSNKESETVRCSQDNLSGTWPFQHIHFQWLAGFFQRFGMERLTILRGVWFCWYFSIG